MAEPVYGCSARHGPDLDAARCLVGPVPEWCLSRNEHVSDDDGASILRLRDGALVKIHPGLRTAWEGLPKIRRPSVLRGMAMQMRYLVAFCPLLLIGCGSTSGIYPIGYTTEVAPPAEAADLQRIDEALEESGFVLTSQPNKQVRFSRDESAILLQIWKWQRRSSTDVGVHQEGDVYRITFTDRQTTGVDLVGEPCRKYLEFMSALKAKFGPEQSRLTFRRETCNP